MSSFRVSDEFQRGEEGRGGKGGRWREKGGRDSNARGRGRGVRRKGKAEDENKNGPRRKDESPENIKFSRISSTERKGARAKGERHSVNVSERLRRITRTREVCRGSVKEVEGVKGKERR
jgi:hypothetical protein